MVVQYTGLNILQVEELDYIDYLMLRRDAFIWMFNQSESGIEYLNNAWRLEQTKPERSKLHEKFGKEG